MSPSTLAPESGTSPMVSEEMPEPIADQLAKAIPRCSSALDGWQLAVTMISRHLDAVYSRIALDSQTGVYQDEQGADAAWSRFGKGLQLKARLQQRPLAKLFHSSGLNRHFGVIAVPLRDADRRVAGGLTIVVPCDTSATLRARMDELAALTRLVHELIHRKTPTTNDSSRMRTDLTRVAKAAEYGSVQEFAFTLTNTLKTKLDCEQVSLGIVHGRTVQLLCISGLDVLYPRAPGAAVIVQAMHECLDAKQATCYQQETTHGKGGAHTGHRLHREWHEKAAHASVACLPLFIRDQCVAILALRRRSSEPFSTSELQRTVEMTTPLASGLLLLDQGQRSLVRHAFDILREEAPRWFGHHGRGRRVLGMLAAALCIWFVCGRTEYEVAVGCTVHPLQRRTLASPFEGVIAARYVEPGDEVRQGELLAELDTRELESQRQELRASLEVAAVERSHATERGDMAAAAQAQARWKIVSAKLAVIDWRLSQAEIRAPVDGVILEGQLTHRVGQVVPLGEPLMEFCATSSGSDAGSHSLWRLELEIPESLAPLLRVGQPGVFAPIARPETRSACTVHSIHATAHRKHSHNYYLARATLQENPPPWIRSGMEGVARIKVGRYPIWWVSLHRLVGAAQLQLWKW